jgi:hypothetical protein
MKEMGCWAQASPLFAEDDEQEKLCWEETWRRKEALRKAAKHALAVIGICIDVVLFHIGKHVNALEEAECFLVVRNWPEDLSGSERPNSSVAKKMHRVEPC